MKNRIYFSFTCFFWTIILFLNNTNILANDITKILQNGLIVDGDVYSGTDDASIGTRKSHSNGLALEYWYSFQRGLIRFDLKPIPPGAINSAILSLYIESYPGLHNDLKNQGKIEIKLYKISQSQWDSNTVSWDKLNIIDNWQNPGGDFEPNPISSAIIDTVDSFQNLWLNFDVTSLIQEYVNNKTELNPGILIMASTRIYPILSFVSSDYGTEPSLRPKLTITYLSQAPFADAGFDQGVVRNEIVTLNGTKSFDPSEPPENLTYNWRFLYKPAMSNLTDNDIIPNNTRGVNGADQPIFVPDALGDYKIELTVTNSFGLSNRDWVTITVMDIKPHPRIWITPERLNFLKSKAQSNSPDWVEFKRVVDTSSKNSAYNYALAYLITGDNIYADKAKAKMWEIYNFDLPKGMPGYLGSYFARSHPPELSVVYDWLYDKLTIEERTMIWQKLNEWADFYFYGPEYEGQWAVNKPHNNFFYGRILGGGLTAIATFGDNPRAKEWFDLVRYDKYERLAKTVFINDYKHGGWLYEGSDYSQASYTYLFQYFWALKTATGENLFRDTGFPIAVIYNMIHNIQPTLDRLLPTGDWTGNQTQGYLDNWPKFIMLLLAEEFKDSTHGEYAQWCLNKSKFYDKYGDSWKWVPLLWYNPNIPERNIAELPLNYFDGDGTGFIYGRSSWDQNATWFAFQSGGGKSIVDHQHYDQNSFYIFKNRWLAAPANVAADRYIGGSTINYNTIVINDGSKDVGQTSRRTSLVSIERYEENQDYIYSLGQAAGAYSNLLEDYARQIIYLKPDYFVIFDRIKTAQPGYFPKWILKSVTEPNVSDNLITINNGEGKMFVKLLSPENLSINKFSSYGWNIHLIDNDQSDQYYTFLNVFQTANSHTQEMQSTKFISSSNGNMLGTEIIFGEGEKIVAMFSKIKVAQIQTAYNIEDAQIIKHLISDLKPNVKYNIYQNENKINTMRASNAGIIYFTSTGGGEFQIIQDGISNTPPTVKITAQPNEGKVPLTVQFNASAVDTDGIITSYSWDFGDGGKSNEQNPTYIYNSPGDYTARIEVTDDLGASATSEIIIKVYKTNQEVKINDASIGTRTSHSKGLSLENWYYFQHCLLRFDLNSIPPGAINSAKLLLYIKSYPGLHNDLKNQGKIQLTLHKITQSAWDDNTANWNTYDGVNNWLAPGGDFDPTPVSTFTINNVDGFQDMWISFDITTLTQEYINNKINPGVLIKASSRLYPILSFVSSESSEISFRPKLEITSVSDPEDNIKPSSITDLVATTGNQPGTIILTWTSPGDDGNAGTATTYVIKYSTSEINNSNWDSAFDINGEPSPQPAGNIENFIVTGLTPGQTYYFAIKTLDEVGNISDISNSPSAMAGREPLGKTGKPNHIDVSSY